MLQLALWICLLIAVDASRPDDMSAFFLKAPKSVPRAGRAAPGHLDSFFLKASKSVPRVGRRNDPYTAEFTESPYEQWLRNELYASANQENLQNEIFYNEIAGTFPEDNQKYSNSKNGNIYDYLATFPNQYNEENLGHRSRRYNTVAYDVTPDSGQAASVDNLSKELTELRYQATV